MRHSPKHWSKNHGYGRVEIEAFCLWKVLTSQGLHEVFEKSARCSHVFINKRPKNRMMCAFLFRGRQFFADNMVEFPGVSLGSIIVANPPANKKRKGVFGDFWSEWSFQHISAARLCRSQWNVKNVRKYTRNIYSPEIYPDWKDQTKHMDQHFRLISLQRYWYYRRRSVFLLYWIYQLIVYWWFGFLGPVWKGLGYLGVCQMTGAPKHQFTMTFPKINPEKWWLEDDPFLLGI